MFSHHRPSGGAAPPNHRTKKNHKIYIHRTGYNRKVRDNKKPSSPTKGHKIIPPAPKPPQPPPANTTRRKKRTKSKSTRGNRGISPTDSLVTRWRPEPFKPK